MSMTDTEKLAIWLSHEAKKYAPDGEPQVPALDDAHAGWAAITEHRRAAFTDIAKRLLRGDWRTA